MAEKKVYKIRIPGALVEVTKEVYLTYYRMARRERAFLVVNPLTNPD